MIGWATGLIAALTEAWGEVRVHKVRVVLSLVGVMLAVLAMTVVTAAGDLARQANAEYTERTSGRPATLGVNVYNETGTIDSQAALAAYADITERYQITYASLAGYGERTFRFADGPALVQLRIVDHVYGDMHRIQPLHGRWFTAADEARFAPSVVVNEAFHARLGAPDLATNPTIVIGGERPVRATVVGVVPDEWDGAEPSAFLLAASDRAWAGSSAMDFGVPTLELWVPPELAEQLTDIIVRDLRGTLGEGTQVDVYRQDAGDFELIDEKLNWVIRGVSLLALALGSLGLVNIALVTVRYRIREIGIRRSFGATSGRVFFSVMMESVWATVVAGAVGVALAVAIVENLPPDLLGVGAITDVPPFPVRAAVEGMIAATAVGALAGLMPAIVAVRVKVIDAIRY